MLMIEKEILTYEISRFTFNGGLQSSIQLPPKSGNIAVTEKIIQLMLRLYSQSMAAMQHNPAPFLSTSAIIVCKNMLLAALFSSSRKWNEIFHWKSVFSCFQINTKLFTSKENKTHNHTLSLRFTSVILGFFIDSVKIPRARNLIVFEKHVGEIKIQKRESVWLWNTWPVC